MSYINDRYSGEYEDEQAPSAASAVNLPPQSAQFAESIPVVVDPTDNMLDLLANSAQPEIDSYVAAIKGLLDSCDSLQEFQGRLPSLFPEMDTESLAKIMADAFLSANLAGQNDVAIGQ